MTRALTRRLTVRFGLALFLGSGLILAAASVWNLRLQRRHLTHLVEARAIETADVFRAATRDAMMRNDPAQVRQIISTAAGGDTVERIRVFDKQGRIRVSSEGGEIGRLVDIAAEQCHSCHAQGEPLTVLPGEDRTRVFRNGDGSRVLGVIAPIHNEPGCAQAACHAHPATQTVLGVLDVQLSLRTVDRDMAASENQLMLAVSGSVLAVLALAGLLTWRMVLRPVERLTEATVQVAGGDFSRRIPVASQDELGRMTEAWNQMIDRLGEAHHEVERWSRTLESRIEAKTRELSEAHEGMLQAERMVSLGKLAAVVAHELNNPLTGIATYAQLLRRRAGDASDPDTARILEMISEESRHCGDIVRNLLLFSRTPGAPTANEDLVPVLERCEMLLRHAAQLQEVEFEVRVSDRPLRLACDPAQMRQLVLALSLNALEASPKGSRVSICAARDPSGEDVWLRVEDEGRGIDADDVPKLFEPFFTTKEEGKGVGLGLAVVYGIVQRHHGEILVETLEGVGTAFTIRLPVEVQGNNVRKSPKPDTDTAREGG